MPYDPDFYERRLAAANDPRKAVWDGTAAEWAKAKRETTDILATYLRSGMRVLDAGCGIGELVECLPPGIYYTGIDYCKGFVETARQRYPGRRFEVDNLLDLSSFAEQFDVCVCRTVEGVIGDRAWPGIAANLLKLAPRVLVFRVADCMADTIQILERK